MRTTSSQRFVLPLDSSAATLERVGGKGASLARLAMAGLPVPAGFHLTTAAYDRFVEANALQEPILAAAGAASADDPASLDRAAAEIRAHFEQGTMPDDVAAKLRDAYGALDEGNASVAVRSSATAEDLPDLSFAGQQETFLNVRGQPALLTAVQRCWASLWTARAIGYRARQGIASQDVSLAVVVQVLVPADAAGVLFTANPLNGARDETIVNAAWGLGEALVGGQVTPDTLVLDSRTGRVLQQEVSDKAVMTVRTDAGTREEAVPADQRRRPVLTPEQAAELTSLGERIEALYGQPMDVEWALHDGRFAILQARPITALPEPGPGRANGAADQATADWPVPDPKASYMRGSVLELLPDPLSPLFETLGVPAYSEALENLMRLVRLDGVFSGTGLVTVNGYGYYEMALPPSKIPALALAIPRVFAAYPWVLGTAVERWRAALARYADLVVRRRSTDPATAPATVLLDGAVDITYEAGRYYLTIQSGILPGAYLSESVFTQAYEHLYRRQGDPPALTFLLGYASAPIEAELSLYDLAQWARMQPAVVDILRDLSPADFTAAYHAYREGTAVLDEAWSAFWQRLQTHLDRFGHTIFDLDFAKAVPADDPASLLEALKFFLSGQAPDPRARVAAAEAAREQATRSLLARAHGPRGRFIAWLLRSAQTFAPLREDALADVGLGWPLLRQLLHALGQRLVEREALAAADDVYWLTLDELRVATTALDAGARLDDRRPLVEERRATWRRQRSLTPPIALPIKGGTRFLGLDIARFMPARSDQGASTSVLRGMAGSTGRVTAPARVIHGPEEFSQMRQGDVLVARITTPAWTPLFALASGVVTDIGGPLSHSSIVAREYHIPAVLGTGVATERLMSGQRVTVDGDAGTVTVAA